MLILIIITALICTQFTNRTMEKEKKDIRIIQIKNKKENLDKKIMITPECHILGIILTTFPQCSNHPPLIRNSNHQLLFQNHL